MSEVQKGKPRGRPFAPGDDRRRNTSGRPRSGLALAERIRERLDPDMILDLAARLAVDESVPVKERITILATLYDRGYNRPATGIALDARVRADSLPAGRVEALARLTPDQQRAYLVHQRALLEFERLLSNESAPKALIAPRDGRGESDDNNP